jgi:hypothetical protein
MDGMRMWIEIKFRRQAREVGLCSMSMSEEEKNSSSSGRTWHSSGVSGERNYPSIHLGERRLAL